MILERWLLSLLSLSDVFRMKISVKKASFFKNFVYKIRHKITLLCNNFWTELTWHSQRFSEISWKWIVWKRQIILMENRSINQNFGNMREKVRLVLMHHLKLQHQNQRLDTYCTLRTQSSLFHQKFHSKVQNWLLSTCLRSFLKKIFTINNTSKYTKILTKNINYSKPIKFRIWFCTTLLIKFY